MIANQTEGLNTRWGLGWMLNNGQFGNVLLERNVRSRRFNWYALLARSNRTLLYPVSESVSAVLKSYRLGSSERKQTNRWNPGYLSLPINPAKTLNPGRSVS
jgi:hypothetical protein